MMIVDLIFKAGQNIGIKRPLKVRKQFHAAGFVQNVIKIQHDRFLAQLLIVLDIIFYLIDQTGLAALFLSVDNDCTSRNELFLPVYGSKNTASYLAALLLAPEEHLIVFQRLSLRRFQIRILCTGILTFHPAGAGLQPQIIAGILANRLFLQTAVAVIFPGQKCGRVFVFHGPADV